MVYPVAVVFLVVVQLVVWENVYSGSTGPSNSLPVIVGVACTLLVLITAAVIIIAVLVCLRKRKKRPDVVDNVAYISGSREDTRNDNMVPSEGKHHIFTSANEAYGISTKMYVDVPTNPAYQAAPCMNVKFCVHFQLTSHLVSQCSS